MAIEAEVICDSVCETAPHRLMTFQVKCPVFVHYEVLRHRAFSFSVASTRAVPLPKQIKTVKRDPFIPIYWGLSKAGMQAGDELTGDDLAAVKMAEETMRWAVVSQVERMEKHGLHKQTAGRYLLPWYYMEMVITSCAPGWMNFFALRCSRMAQPEMRRLAVRMADAYRKSVPRVLKPGWWHLPYVTDEELDTLGRWRKVCPDDCYFQNLREVLAFSVARCARVSFLRHGFDHSGPQKDIESHDRFLNEGAWSVFEPQARAPMPGEDVSKVQGNLTGWVQYRQLLNPNVHTDFDFSILDQFSEDLQ